MLLGTEVRRGQGDIVLDGHPAPPTERGIAQHPPHTFRPMSIVAKGSPVSATAELLCCVFFMSNCHFVLALFTFCCLRFSFFSTKPKRLAEDIVHEVTYFVCSGVGCDETFT